MGEINTPIAFEAINIRPKTEGKKGLQYRRPGLGLIMCSNTLKAIRCFLLGAAPHSGPKILKIFKNFKYKGKSG